MGAAWLAMGLIPLLGGAWLGAKHGGRVEPRAPRVLAAAVLAWGWITVGMEVLGTAGRLDPTALVSWSLAGLAVGGLVAWLRPVAQGGDPVAAPSADSLGFAALLATALVAWAGVRLGLVSLIQPVKVVSDGPIYHLYFAARWWRAGRIFPVATPFGEVGATYFWANGELWYSWLMTLAGGDRFAKLGQVPFLWLGGLAVERIARHLKVRPAAARIAALWFVAIGPEFVFAFEPNVDSLLVAGYTLGAYFFLRGLTAPGGVNLGFIILGSLGAGLGMGTKPIGIVFFPPLLLVAMALVGWHARGNVRAGLLGGVAALLPALAMMGYWPIRNAWLTGNLLYPLHVEAVGTTWLRGWFGPGAMSQSPYYIPREDGRAFVDIMLGVFDPRLIPLWLAAALGGWTWWRRRDIARDVAVDRWVWGFTALAAFDLAAYWLVIPYRTQQRFAFPAVALFAVPLARFFDRAGWIRVVAVVLLALHLGTPQTWPFAASEREIPWDLVPGIPNYVPGPLEIPLTSESLARQTPQRQFRATVKTAVGVLGAAGIGAFATWVRAGSRRWTLRSLALVWLVPWVVAASVDLGAQTALPFPFFPNYLAGWTELEARAGPKGARVAYAGTNIPYYLLGSKLQNEVRYVNIDAHPGWLLHDYHQNAANVGEPTTWPNPLPIWDRLRPDYDAWRANLRAERIDLLVVTRVNIPEGAANAADAERFPIERGWADAHPESFRPIYGQAEHDPWFKLYQVLP